jgi:quinol---cytochrome c reductase iron-sulfur subunit, bacillus type
MDSPGSRRGFLGAVAATIGAVIAGILTFPALRFLVYPARRRIVSDSSDFVPVASAGAIREKPLRVEITAAVQRDAWSKVENVRLGSAWLVKGKDGDIRALTTTCPHLGCSIDYDPQADRFRCPCHKSTFALTGDRISGPAKRGMDPLDSRVEADGRVTVRFRKFKQDTSEREEA